MTQDHLADNLDRDPGSLDAQVAAYLLRSCGLNSIPATLPAFFTLILAALYVIGKIRFSGSTALSLMYARKRTTTFRRMNTTSASLPLLGLWIVNLWSRTSSGVSCRTSPILIPALAISSRISRFLTFVLLDHARILAGFGVRGSGKLHSICHIPLTPYSVNRDLL